MTRGMEQAPTTVSTALNEVYNYLFLLPFSMNHRGKPSHVTFNRSSVLFWQNSNVAKGRTKTKTKTEFKRRFSGGNTKKWRTGAEGMR
ncbi:unnamed protein product [Arctogadus glacialis]